MHVCRSTRAAYVVAYVVERYISVARPKLLTGD